MRRRTSLTARLVIGSVLWTIGIVVVVHHVSLALVHRFPRTMGSVHFALLGILLVGLLIAALAQVRGGLAPLHQLRARLAGVRAGHARHVEGDYPAEVQPLVDDLNALLDERERRVARAQAKAGDLAHGLKTPLAVLAQEAERAAAAGHREMAAVIGEQVERMRRQVESHLATARAAGPAATAGERSSVAESAAALARTLLRLHADRGLTIDVHAAPGHFVRIARADLDEMLGNLLDNACKWARSRVVFEAAVAPARARDRAAGERTDPGGGNAASEAEHRVVITVDDDGPGLSPELRENVLRRGVRADEAAPGSGLGLAIVRDLAELYGGTIALDASPAGGLRARLELPAG